MRRWFSIREGVRVNKQIGAPQVRVINAEGKQIGIMEKAEALLLAQREGLDLVEVAPDSKPPVCRIIDYGKYRYKQSKRAKEARKKQHVTHLKEIKVRPKMIRKGKVKFLLTWMKLPWLMP